ncbi:MAG: PAS domain-containing protein [Enterocloster sp.]
MGRSFRLESSFQSLIDALDIGIIGTNEHGNIFVYNKKAEKIIGFSLEDANWEKSRSSRTISSILRMQYEFPHDQ